MGRHRMMATEHILLESDEREIPDAQAARKVHASLRLRNAFRRHAIALDIIDYYFLSVRTRHWRSGPAEYVLDLRFIDPRLRLARHIAWRWMYAALGLGALTVGSAWWIATSANPWWKHGWFPVCLGFLFATALAGLVCAYRTTETLTVYSGHGHAQLLRFVGSLGTFRSLRRFTVKLAAHVRIAFAARRPNKTEHLRDEMREHFRLKEAGVISDEDYDQSKRLILQQHA
jgi:hypothetical protein